MNTNNVLTRARAKKMAESKDEYTTSEISVTEYVKTIENLKKELVSKETLNNLLIEEQDNNSKEFEKICKQLNLLKKRVFDEETKNSDLKEQINSLLEDNANLSREQEECGYMTRLTNLKKDFDSQKSELIETQLKYGDLFLKSLNSSSVKKGFNTHLKSRINNNKKKINNIKHNNRKMVKKINLLTVTKGIMEIELDRRELALKTLQNESEKLLDTIYVHEQDLKQNEVTLGKVAFLEKQLVKLQKIIENKMTTLTQPNVELNLKLDDKLVKNTKQDNAATNTLMELSSVPAQYKEKTQRIVMFSDCVGKTMAGLITEYLPKTHKIMNLCKVGCEFGEIINEDFADSNHDETIAVMIGNFKSIGNNYGDYVATIDRIAENMKKMERKVIVTTLLYGQRDIVNAKLKKVNSKLYTLASLHSNLNIIEINTEGGPQFYSKKGREAAANYIATACLRGVNRSNLRILSDFTGTKDPLIPTQNFPLTKGRKHGK